MATLRDVQLEQVDILRAIKDTCEKNDISYFLAYGSLLGAVRHYGFIPWDDDSDVHMSLKNFRKFCQVFNKEGMFLQTEKTEKGFPFIIYKVRKNGTLMQEKGMEKLNIHQGIWVDIFVYIDAPKIRCLKKLQHSLSVLLRTFRCRRLAKVNGKENLLHKVANHLPEKLNMFIDKCILGLMTILGNPRSGEVMMLSNGSYRSMHFPAYLFDETAEYSFEGEQFSSVKNYHDYLTLHYGKDYMTPKQWGGHTTSYENVVCQRYD